MLLGTVRDFKASVGNAQRVYLYEVMLPTDIGGNGLANALSAITAGAATPTVAAVNAAFAAGSTQAASAFAAGASGPGRAFAAGGGVRAAQVDPTTVSAVCQGVRFGDYGMAELHGMRYGAEQRFYAGAMSIKSASLRFVRPKPDAVTLYFKAWRNLIVDGKGFYSAKRSYARNVVVRMYDTDFVTVTGTYKLVGAWPLGLPSYDLSDAADGVVYVDIPLSVDRIE